MAEVFIRDDNGYRQWREQHPDAFVINSHARQLGTGYVLHRSSCFTISGEPARGTYWTHEYLKLCGEAEDLPRAAKVLIGKKPAACSHCDTGQVVSRYDSVSV